MKERDKMHTGELYLPGDEEIMKEQTACLEKLYDYNATRPSEGEKRARLLKEMFLSIGEGSYIEPPLHANWGCNTHLGSHVYANFNLTLVDDTDIYIGDYTMIPPYEGPERNYSGNELGNLDHYALFNMAEDPHQLHDISADNPELLEKMKSAFHEITGR